jgi:hypothetical protein
MTINPLFWDDTFHIILVQAVSLLVEDSKLNVIFVSSELPAENVGNM